MVCEVNVDLIGFFGLIILLLDEMVNVVKEMECQGFIILVLIGGVIILKVYMVVKIEQNYSGLMVYVQNVLCIVGVVVVLFFDIQCDDFVVCICKEYEIVCIQYVCKKLCMLLVMLEVVCDNDLVFDWECYILLVVYCLGVQEVEVSIEILCNYIDWMLFFMIWLLVGKYLCILEDEVVGIEVQCLFKDVNDMLDKLSVEKLLNLCGVVGLFLVNCIGDDIEIYCDEICIYVLMVSYYLCQQIEKVGFVNYCLVDFVVLKLSGKVDYIGVFVVIGGLEEDVLVDVFEV